MDHLHEIASPLSLPVLRKIRCESEDRPDVPKITLPRYTPVVKHWDRPVLDTAIQEPTR